MMMSYMVPGCLGLNGLLSRTIKGAFLWAERIDAYVDR